MSSCGARGAQAARPLRLVVVEAQAWSPVKLSPTPLTAALAGALAGIVMPMLWNRLAGDSMMLVLAFLLVVALPAHALVVGFGRNQTADARTLDTALLKRVGAWLLTAVASTVIAQAVRA